MSKYRCFLRKYKIPLAIASFIFIGLPQYIDSLWSLYEKISGIDATGLNITWLYWVTVPIGSGMLGYIIRQSARVGAEESKSIWEHYERLSDLILKIETAPHEKWTEIVADMQRELTAIGDSKLDEMMSLYFDVLDEDEMVGINPARFVSKVILERTRKHMDRKYPRR